MRLLTTFAMMAVAVTAFADEFDMKVANIDVLRDKVVQKELGVTTGQLKTLNKHAQDFEAAGKKKIEEYQKAKKQPDAAFQTFSEALVKKLRGQVLGTLSPGQIKRLRELTLQLAGPRALLDQAVALKCGMTTKEHSALTAAVREGDRAVAKIKQEVGLAVREKHKSDAKPKDGKAADALQKKIFEELNAGMKKRESEVKAILLKADTKTKSIVKKTHLDKLQALMGKIFTPPKPKK